MPQAAIVFAHLSARGVSPVQAAVAAVSSVVQKLTYTLNAVEAGATSLVPRWEAEKAVHGEKPLEMLITDCAEAGAGEVIYALYTKKIPTLVSRDLFLTLEKNFSADIGKNALLYCEQEGEGLEAATKRFLYVPEEEGRVFVVEGGDGAGKQTQVAKLCEKLKSQGLPVQTLDFPHDAAKYGTLIRDLLSGRMGNIKEVNPLIFAALYGLNRHDTLPELRHWMLKGNNVILDRYMTANFGHQASKYTEDSERIAAIETLKKFELNWLGLPDAHKVVYLNLPAQYAMQAMQTDGTRKELDMHELAGVEYKNNVRDSFVWCCKTFPGWNEVKCVDEAKDARHSREDIHNTIYSLLKDDFVSPTMKL